MRISIRLFSILLFIWTMPVLYASGIEDLKQKWSDTVITTKIKTQFTKNKNLNPLKISVTTKNGVVTLKGHAKNNTAFVDALRIVTNTHGVRSINTTAFDIKSVNSTLADAYITAKIEAAILEAKVLDDESIPLVGINTSTSNGIVTLTGVVKHKHAVVAMIKRARHVRGVKKIRSHLTIAEDNPK
ncbi:MAG TPA: BON domain-containing protein [Legionellaceae bacterium]|nr:BON domain-containing protein [Legionellaceae bacterium]